MRQARSHRAQNATQWPRQQDSAPIGPAITRPQLGTHLRALRHARSLGLEEVAAKLDVAPSTVSRIETGKAPTRTAFLAVLFDLYGVDDPDERARLTGLARDGQRKPWWAGWGSLLPEGTGPYLDLEAAAANIRVHATRVIPALAQIPAYAAAAACLTRPGLTNDEYAVITAAYRHRPRHLRPGHQLHLVIGEAALAAPIAPPGVMASQYRHLLAIAAAPAVTVQVSTLAPVLSGSFTVLSFTEPSQAAVTCHQAPADRIITTKRETDARSALAIFQAVASAALSPADSADLITNLTPRGVAA